MPRGGRGGSQPVYTLELADKICARLAEGRALKAVCRDDDIPVSSTAVRLWADEDKDGFASRFAHARAVQMDALADEIIEMADNATNEDVQAVRLRVDARKWIMSKIAPKKYGDKLDLTHAAPDGGPVQFITIYEAKKEKP
jgi:hypothetical protein